MIAQIVFGADTRTATSMFTGQYVVFGPFFLSQAQIVAFIVAVAATLGVELLLRPPPGARRCVRWPTISKPPRSSGSIRRSFTHRKRSRWPRASPGIAAPFWSPNSRPRLGRLLLIADHHHRHDHRRARQHRGTFPGRHLLRRHPAGHRDDVELAAAGRSALCLLLLFIAFRRWWIFGVRSE